MPKVKVRRTMQGASASNNVTSKYGGTEALKPGLWHLILLGNVEHSVWESLSSRFLLVLTVLLEQNIPREVPYPSLKMIKTVTTITATVVCMHPIFQGICQEVTYIFHKDIIFPISKIRKLKIIKKLKDFQMVILLADD